jgi:DNA-directed RNA polymerase specialized sigma24 family protein
MIAPESGAHLSPEPCKPAVMLQDELFAIFDSNPSRAEEKYLELFRKLVRFFEWSRSPEPEDMAQEALRRGFTRLGQGQKITTRDPAGYFFGIARNLVREGWNTREQEQFEEQQLLRLGPSFYNLNPIEQVVFLKQVLHNLSKDEIAMLVAYVEGSGEAWGRKAGLEPGALRLRIHRLRKRLEKLVGSVPRPKNS